MIDDASREKWDRRYGAQAFDPRLEPIPFLRDHLDLSTGGRALCLAAGNGRNAVFLAQNGDSRWMRWIFPPRGFAFAAAWPRPEG